jgi:hypothetical protein
MSDTEDDPLNQRYQCKYVLPGTVIQEVTYELLLETPHKIKNWIKRFPCDELGVTKVLSAASMNDVYAEKVISYSGLRT